MPNTKKKSSPLADLTDEIAEQEDVLRAGGGPAGQARQKKLGRLPVRDRLKRLLDPDAPFLEIGLWAAHEMYPAAGVIAAAGVVTGVGTVSGRSCMVIANDATVKAGAFFPATAKKVIRAQKIAARCNLPLIYLVDSAGVYLPMQDEIFPDEDDFGRIFRNNAVLSAMGVPQIAAIMGNCVAGGAYLPVLCDKVLMTDGSELDLAGPALVKAAIGQEVDREQLGGAAMHARVSGTIDFHEKDDGSCLKRLRSLVELLPADPPPRDAFAAAGSGSVWNDRIFPSPGIPGEGRGEGLPPDRATRSGPHPNPLPEYRERGKVKLTHYPAPAEDADRVYDLVGVDGRKEYDVRDVLTTVVDTGSFIEYKTEYGQTLVCGYASIGGQKIGVVANQHVRCKSAQGELQIGGVIYHDSADKAARFVMDCSQTGLPLVFFQDVVGFMVGRDSEQHGIIRSGAKLVNAVSNAAVPKITVVIGGSFGAGHYALCGRAFDPAFIFAWPGARYAVMGAGQAADTLLSIESKSAERRGKKLGDKELAALHEKIKGNYQRQTDIRYGAARGWVDAIIAPHTTRDVLVHALRVATRPPPRGGFHGGVMQV